MFTGDHTVYLYNESSGADVVTTSAEISCVCEFATITAPSTTPTITSVSPTVGPTTGGPSVILTGTRYVSGASVTFGGASATGVIVVNSNTITATTPSHAAGAVDIRVTNPSSETGDLTNGFTYLVAPSVTSISPTSGATGGGTSVTITGDDFASGATVTFSGDAATGVTVVTSTNITATTPAHADGAVDVVVTNPDSQTGTSTKFRCTTFP